MLEIVQDVEKVFRILIVPRSISHFPGLKSRQAEGEPRFFKISNRLINKAVFIPQNNQIGFGKCTALWFKRRIAHIKAIYRKCFLKFSFGEYNNTIKKQTMINKSS